MTKKKDKVLYRSKPTVWYYLLVMFFPIMFFLIDDSKQLLFGHWRMSTKTYIINSLALFIFLGIPVLMYILRREIIIYRDRIDIYKPTINTSKTYYFTDLLKWNVADVYIPKAGNQINLVLKFKNKKLTFNKIELTGFATLVKILEEDYADKKVSTLCP